MFNTLKVLQVNCVCTEEYFILEAHVSSKNK